MKNNYINTITFLILTLYTSISLSQEIQIFEISPLHEEEITGKKGTVIYLSKNSFNLNKHPKLTLKLKENLSIKENQLPFSIQFFYEGNEIGLKEGEKLDIYTPINNIKFQKHFILNSKNESGKIKWFKANHFYEQVYIELGGGISKTISLHKDSITKKIKSGNRNFLTKQEYDKKHPQLPDYSYNFFIPKNLKKVYIPYFVKVEESISFYVKKKGNKYFQPRFFIYYENLKMYDEISKLPDEPLNFKNIPIFENTFLIVVKEDFDMDKRKSIYYSDKIKLNKSLNNKLLKLNLKKASKQDLRKLFE